MLKDRSDEAERWFQRMHAADRTVEEGARFERWLAAHPAHAIAYQRTEYLFRRAADLRSQPDWREQARLARQRTAQRARFRRIASLGTAAAAVMVLAVGIVWGIKDVGPSAQHYATAIGERRTLMLEDGSKVILDTDSALAVTYSWRQRRLVLEHGRAQFSVAKQRLRPFVVETGAGEIRALGTQFQVRKTDDAMLVTLLEGVVSVEMAGPPGDGQRRVATLAAGEQLRVDGSAWSMRRIDVQAAQGWTRGELSFDRTPLAELIEEMNRYTTVKLRIGAASMGDLPVSGVFYDNDQESLIAALAAGWSLRADRISATEIVLRPAH